VQQQGNNEFGFVIPSLKTSLISVDCMRRREPRCEIAAIA
jgi:hypothetical protein